MIWIFHVSCFWRKKRGWWFWGQTLAKKSAEKNFAKGRWRNGKATLLMKNERKKREKEKRKRNYDCRLSLRLGWAKKRWSISLKTLRTWRWDHHRHQETTTISREENSRWTLTKCRRFWKISTEEGKTAATPTMDSLDFLPTRMIKMKSWRRNRKERKKKKKKMVMMMMIKILVSRRNYYPTRRMIVRVNCECGQILHSTRENTPEKARAERRCSRTRKRN